MSRKTASTRAELPCDRKTRPKVDKDATAAYLEVNSYQGSVLSSISLSRGVLNLQFPPEARIAALSPTDEALSQSLPKIAIR